MFPRGQTGNLKGCLKNTVRPIQPRFQFSQLQPLC
jgi:hypothetical protein